MLYRTRYTKTIAKVSDRQCIYPHNGFHSAFEVLKKMKFMAYYMKYGPGRYKQGGYPTSIAMWFCIYQTTFPFASVKYDQPEGMRGIPCDSHMRNKGQYLANTTNQ